MLELLVDRLELVVSDYNSLKSMVQNISMSAGSMIVKKLKNFTDIMLQTTFTKASDFSNIEGLLKEVIENPGNYDRMVDIVENK